MKNVQLSLSTVIIFDKNTQYDRAIEAINNIEYLTSLLDDIKHDYELMVEDFGEQDDDVVRYKITIKELTNKLQNLKLQA